MKDGFFQEHIVIFNFLHKYYNMQSSLSAVYYCATSNNCWGKGYTIKEAKTNAGLTSPAKEKKCHFYVTSIIVKDCSKDELKRIHNLITANEIDGNAKFIKLNPDDMSFVISKHVGWLMVEKNY